MYCKHIFSFTFNIEPARKTNNDINNATGGEKIKNVQLSKNIIAELYIYMMTFNILFIYL